MKTYYHLFANGADAKNFIISEEEKIAAFNRVGVCKSLTEADVVAFSIEESHPHILLWGTFEECRKFRDYYQDISCRSIVRRRGSLDGVVLHCELYEVNEISYLRNVATYTIVQATKDGKRVMPYDYLYGTGSLYFRSGRYVLPWMIDNNGNIVKPVYFRELSTRQKRMICGSKSLIPDDWLVCNGFVLPTNYIEIARFEEIYKTHNCFRVFLASGKNLLNDVLDKMASVRGVMIDDIEARKLCESICMELFCRKGTRHITPEQRVNLARELYKRYSLSTRQLSILTKLPEEEIYKYIR